MAMTIALSHLIGQISTRRLWRLSLSAYVFVYIDGNVNFPIWLQDNGSAKRHFQVEKMVLWLTTRTDISGLHLVIGLGPNLGSMLDRLRIKGLGVYGTVSNPFQEIFGTTSMVRAIR